MPQTPSSPAVRVPLWIMIVGSLIIVFHLSSVGVRALAARSGPWPSDMGFAMYRPPAFASHLNWWFTPYQDLVRMENNFHIPNHCPSNRPSFPGVYIEAKLMNASGQEIARVKLPEDDVNFWVRHRQQLMVNGLVDDNPINLPQSEVIPPPGQQVPEIDYWQTSANEQNVMRLARRSINAFERDRPHLQPGDQSKVLVSSFARYLCQTHGADKVEIIRHHKDPIPPDVLKAKNVSASAFQESESYFGEYTREGKPIR